MTEFLYNSGIGHDTSVQEMEAGSQPLTSQQRTHILTCLGLSAFIRNDTGRESNQTCGVECA